MKYISQISKTAKEYVGIEISRFTILMPTIATALMLSADAAYKAQMYRLTAILSAASSVVIYEAIRRIYKQIDKIKE